MSPSVWELITVCTTPPVRLVLEADVVVVVEVVDVVDAADDAVAAEG
jgi:hypothetical protein